MTAPTAFESKVAVSAGEPITTVEQLRAHLYQAAQVEMSTIPLYLYAAYSIEQLNYSQWSPGISAFRAIRSVVIEEMLHLCLARNLLLSVGGADEIRFYDPDRPQDFAPDYPVWMLHKVDPPLLLTLAPCTRELCRDVFMVLEQPEGTDAPPQPDQYQTLGQFYKAIADGFDAVAPSDPWDLDSVQYQYARAYWNQDGGGEPVVVWNLETAHAAIREIVEQGEGASPDGEVPLNPTDPQLGMSELSHYAKFKRIAEGIDGIGDLWPVPENPKAASFPAPVDRLATLFNAAFSYLLAMLDALYAASSATIAPGARSPRYALERTAIAAMGGLLYPIASLLVRQPIGDGLHAAPTFEFFRFEEGVPKKQQLAELCESLLAEYPALGGSDSVRALIERLPSV